MVGRWMGGVAASVMLAVVAGACAPTSGVSADVQSPQPTALFSAERLSESIRAISTDEFQGRYPGTEGERKTLAWLQAQYEQMGLQPGGPNGQWLQRVELKRYTPTEGAQSASWKGPDGQTRALTPWQDISLRAVTNDGRAEVRDAALVFAGYGISAPERSWDDYGSVDVRGKVVVVFAGEPDGDRFNGPYQTNYASGQYKADEAFRRGAVGIVTVNAVNADAPQWRSALRGGQARRTMTPGAADLEFSVGVPHDVAQAWAQAAGVDVRRIADLGGGSFKAFPLTGVTLSVKTEERVETLVTHNLLARIPGAKRPDETVVYSAHWDHVGVDAEHAVNGDSIFNGAWDNASGTVAVVEMARAFSRTPRPDRSIVFAHMAAEEMGLLGAYAYAADPVYPLATTVADINIDMIPLSGPTRDIPIFGVGQNDLEDRLGALAAREGRYVTDDGQPEQNFYYRSDHFPFARMGVPAIMPWHGRDLVEGGKEEGWRQWRAKFAADYHKPSDEWSADWDLRGAMQNLPLLYELGLNLANSTDWPGWKPTSEFGQVRARSDSARR